MTTTLLPPASPGLALEPLATTQLYERVMGRLTAQIADGVLKPGDRLPSERELARRLQVSRPVVREAIGALQNERLVWTRHGAGTFVADAALEILRDGTVSPRRDSDASPVAVLEARAILEPAAAELAARRGGSADEARRLLERMEEVVDIRDDEQLAVWSDSDRLFHRELAVMSGNPVLVQLADHVASLMAQPLWQTLRNDALLDPNRRRTYTAEHRVIIEAVARRDPEAAAHVAAMHLRHVRADMELDQG